MVALLFEERNSSGRKRVSIWSSHHMAAFALAKMKE
jgi:hypothetical protein